MSYTKEDIIRIVKEEDIEFIRMQFVDIFGQLKNVAITASQIEKAVNNQITFDGSSIEGYTRINESDQYLYPDLNSFAIFPWRPAQGKVARLICDVYNPDGTPFVGDPRFAGCSSAAGTWALMPSTSGRSWSSSSLRLTTRATPPPSPGTRRATSTWAPWTTVRAPAGRSA